MTNFIIYPYKTNCNGGTYSFLKKLMSTLSQMNIKFEVVLHENDNLISQLLKSEIPNLRIVQIPKRIFKGRALEFIEDTIRTNFFISQRTQGGKLIISTGQPRSSYGLLFFRKSCLYFLHTVPNSPSSKKIFFFDLIIQKIATRVRYATVSQYSKKKMTQHLGINSNNILVAPSIPSINEEIKIIEPKKNIILTVGHVSNYKNPYLWLEVAKEVTSKCDWVFHWIGDGPLLANFIELTKGDSRIVFKGYIEDIQEYYKMAKIYFQPSLKESQGIAILEAMGFGLPCVVSNNEGIPENVIDNVTGKIVTNSTSTKSYSEAIMELINNEELVDNYGDNARKHILLNYNQEKYNDSIKDLLKCIE